MPALSLDDIDFGWVQKCTKVKQLREAQRLLANEPYVELKNAVRARLKELDPQGAAREAEPSSAEVAAALSDIDSWAEDMERSERLKQQQASAATKRELPPVRGSIHAALQHRDEHTARPQAAEAVPIRTGSSDSKNRRDEPETKEHINPAPGRSLPSASARDRRGYDEWSQIAAQAGDSDDDGEKEQEKKDTNSGNSGALKMEQEQRDQRKRQQQQKTAAALVAERDASRAEQEKIKGNESFKAKDYQEAVQYYTTAVTLDPSLASAFANRAMARIKLGVGQYHNAEEDCTKALQLLDKDDSKPLRIKALYRRGLARIELAKYVEATSDLRAALELDPGSKVVLTAYKKAEKKRKDVGATAAPPSATSSTAQHQQKPARRLNIVEVDESDSDDEEAQSGSQTQTAQSKEASELAAQQLSKSLGSAQASTSASAASAAAAEPVKKASNPPGKRLIVVMDSDGDDDDEEDKDDGQAAAEHKQPAKPTVDKTAAVAARANANAATKTGPVSEVDSPTILSCIADVDSLWRQYPSAPFVRMAAALSQTPLAQLERIFKGHNDLDPELLECLLSAADMILSNNAALCASLLRIFSTVNRFELNVMLLSPQAASLVESMLKKLHDRANKAKDTSQVADIEELQGLYSA